MFSGGWAYLVLGTLLPAVILREPALLLVSILLFLTGLISRVWDRYLFAGVEYSRTLSHKRLFFGEKLTLQVQVANRKILPLTWFRVEEEVPDAITFTEDTQPAYSPGRRVLATGLSMRWYTKVTRRYTATCDRRGSFIFGPAKVEAGDLFGFFRRSMPQPGSQHVLVYPRILPLAALGIPSKELFGDVRVRRHISEDPARVLGTREYAPTDPLKRIHWKSTARVGRLQTKLLEPVTSTDAALFLDTRTVEPPYWGFIDQLLELGVITAASIASYAQQRDIRTGLYVNQGSLVEDTAIRLPPSSHPEQLPRILESLAQVQAQELLPIARLVQQQARSLPWNTTLVAITAVPTPALVSALIHLQRAGRSTALVLIGHQATEYPARGIPTYRVSDAVPWRELDGVSMERKS